MQVALPRCSMCVKVQVNNCILLELGFEAISCAVVTKIRHALLTRWLDITFDGIPNIE
jgi:hypothetical protein